MKKSIILSFLLAVLLCTSLSSCVSILGASKSININSSPAGASVYRDDGKYVGKTPLVYKGKAHHDFNLKKEGFYDFWLTTTKSFNPLYLLNILIMPYGFFEFNNAMKFKDTEYFASLRMKSSPSYTEPTYTSPVPTHIPSLIESVSANSESYTCASSFTKIKPSYSNLTKRPVLKGSEVFKKYSSAVFMIYGATSNNNQIWQGSGFFVNADGLAVSNYHNFEGASEIVVKLYESDSLYEITKDDILAYSKSEDFIIFKVKGRNSYPFIPIANKRSEVGDKVYTIGSPKGLENTFSSGEISQYRTEQGFIQITAPIDHGSSGGVLINEYGEAIGITSAGRDDSGANLNFSRDLLYIMNRYK